NIMTLSEQSEDVLRDKLDEAKARHGARKDRVEQIGANLKAWAEQKMSETKEMVSEWKAKQDGRKLIARADRAEAYAADALDFARPSTDEAEEAILDAAVAGIEAAAAH